MKVAIDGPAGVGKTTTARRLADRLGYLYVDTGAMYRALALKAIRAGASVDDEAACGALAEASDVSLEPDGQGGARILLDGQDVTALIRTPEVSDGASRIAVHRAVRERMVALQRALSRRPGDAEGRGSVGLVAEGHDARGADASGAGGAHVRGTVMEGRDIGTVVLPDADVKVFLTATPEERARRRWNELKEKDTAGRTVPLEAVLEQIRERDARDSGRAVDPLRPAADAVIIDSTSMDPDEQLEAILALTRGR